MKLKALTSLFIMSILVLSSIPCFGVEEDSLFTEAGQFYQAGRYEEALKNYLSIVDMDFENGPLHYNIGNCYYKLQDIGRTILHYERALKWMPGDEDLKSNLALANLSVVDKITPGSRFILIRIIDGFIHLFPMAIHTGLVIGLYVIGIGFFILYVISGKRILKLIGFRLGIAAGVLFLMMGLTLFSRIQAEKKRNEAVILAERVDVMSAPGEDGIEVFALHEGTRVRVDQTTGDWLEIILADGKVGWVRKEVLEVI